jgi:hypothetical protein
LRDWSRRQATGADKGDTDDRDDAGRNGIDFAARSWRPSTAGRGIGVPGLALFLGQHVIQYGLIMAGSVLAIVPMVIAFLLIQRRFVETIATSGLR